MSNQDTAEGDCHPTNCSAFPIDMDDGSGRVTQHGMTLRDYFAAKHMAALEISQTLAMCHDKAAAPSEGWYETLAEEAYRAADAMLIHRQNEGGQQP